MAAPVSAPARQRPLFALLIRLGAAMTLAIMAALVKLASDSGLTLPEILFWRQLPTVPCILALFLATGRLDRLKTRRLPQHGVRAGFGVAGMFLNLGAVTLLPLAEATTFNFTSSIWAVILSALVLHERIGAWRWGAVALGFLGVVWIAQPGSGNIPLAGALVALGGAFMVALISIQIRDLAQSEDALTIVFYFAAFSLPLLAAMLPFFATPGKTGHQWLLLIGLGVSGLVGQVLLTAALRYGPVASVIVMDYSGLIWATVLGWAIFGVLPPSTLWLGAPLVIVAGMTIAWREHVTGRRNLARQGAL